jgi:hypothetical protein
MTQKKLIIFSLIFIYLNAQSISITDFLRNNTQSLPPGCMRVDSNNNVKMDYKFHLVLALLR